MPNMMMAATTMVNNNSGNTSITSSSVGSTTEIAMDNEVISTDTDVMDADLTNNGILFKKTGWYLVWGAVNVKMNAAFGLLAFASQMYLDPGGVGSPAAVSHAIGETSQVQYDNTNNLIEVFGTSAMSPIPIQVTTANSVLTIRCVVASVLGTLTVTSAKDGDDNGVAGINGTAKGTSYIAANYLADATLP